MNIRRLPALLCAAALIAALLCGTAAGCAASGGAKSDPADSLPPSTTTAETPKKTGGDTLPYRLTMRYPITEKSLFTYPDAQRLTFTDGQTGKTFPYRLFVPADYDKNGHCPVLFFLHGASERGTDNGIHIRVLEQSFRRAGDFLNEAIVLAPQCPADGWWGLDEEAYGDENGWRGAALRLLRQTLTAYACDTERVYVAGLSMGGYATWSLLERHGELFAAAVPICGWGNTAMGSTLAKIPIWAFHSTDDPTVSYYCSLEMVDAIKAAGGRMARLERLTGVGHNAWDTALGSRKMFSWMFAQTKPKGLRGDDSYTSAALFRLVSPSGEPVLTEDDVVYLTGQLHAGQPHLAARLTPAAADRLRTAYAAYAGQEFTVEYVGQPYYRFVPLTVPQDDEFVFAQFAKTAFYALL